MLLRTIRILSTTALLYACTGSDLASTTLSVKAPGTQRKPPEPPYRGINTAFIQQSGSEQDSKATSVDAKHGIQAIAIPSVVTSPNEHHTRSQRLGIERKRVFARSNRCVRNKLEVFDRFLTTHKARRKGSEQAEKLLSILRNTYKDEDKSVRTAVINSLAGLLPWLSVQQITQMLFIALRYDSEKSVRLAAMRVLEDIANERATYRKAIINTLLQEYSTTNNDGVQKLRSALKTLTESSPSHAKVFLPLILADCSSVNPRIQVVAMTSLMKVLKVAPEQARNCLKTLIKVTDECRDDAPREVRKVAIEALGGIVKWVPERASDVFKVVRRACYDLKRAVASAAIEALVKVARVAPELSDEIVATILVTCKSDFHAVRDQSMDALATVAKIISTQQIVQLLIQACKDDNMYVHQAGYCTIVGLGGILTTQPEVQAAILKACHNIHPQVRAAAVSALGESVKAASIRKGAMLEALIYACKEDTDGDVRCIAIPALESVIPVVQQEMRQTILSVLVKACKDTDCEACEAAVCAIVTAAKHVSKQATLDALLNAACDARYYTARRTACCALERLAGVFTVEKIFTKLLQACSDDFEEVALAASQVLARVVIKDPTRKLFERLLKHYDTADDSSRCAILKSFEYILLRKPAYVDEILAVLQKACLCSDENIHITATCILIATGKRVPQHTMRMIKFFIEYCKNDSVRICHRATKTLMELIKIAPCGRTIEILLAAHNNKHNKHRAITERMLVEGVKMAASQPTLEALLAAYQKYDWKAVDSNSITKALKALLLAQPSHASHALEFLLKACKAPSRHVHFVATEALVEILKIAPEHVSDILEDLLGHCGSTTTVSAGEQSIPSSETKVSANRRQQAISLDVSDASLSSQIAATSETSFEFKLDLGSSVVSSSNSIAEANTHYVSATTFSQLIKAAPTGKAFQTMLNTLRASSNNASLRVVAISTLEALAKAAPIYAEESIAHILEVAMNDTKANVRYAAIGTIEGLIDVASTCSDKTLQKIWLALKKACKDHDAGVRDAAEALLEEIKKTNERVDLLEQWTL